MNRVWIFDFVWKLLIFEVVIKGRLCYDCGVKRNLHRCASGRRKDSRWDNGFKSTFSYNAKREIDQSHFSGLRFDSACRGFFASVGQRDFS